MPNSNGQISHEDAGSFPDRVEIGPNAGDAPTISAQDFRESFGEDIHHALDLETWRTGTDLTQEYDRIASEVRLAAEHEGTLEHRIRQEIFPRLERAHNAPKNAGVYPAQADILAEIHRGLLFSGGVEACDGTIQVHTSLPLTIFQIGVSLVSYRGDQGTWSQRLFRKDLHQETSGRIDELIEILERRAKRSATTSGGMGDRVGQLVQKTVLDYGERAVLLNKSQAPWRMGRGNPVTYELLTGGGNPELMVEAIRVLRGLIEGWQKFVFVASEPRDFMLLTIAQALPPWHFAIVQTLEDQIEDWLHQLRFASGVATKYDWDNEPLSAPEWIPRFIKDVASKVVIGLFRASPLAPAHLFYAHVDHADLAAHIVLADSMLQEHRGYPLLNDLAHHVCDSVFGNTLQRLADTAYAAAGVPWRYSISRPARNR